VAALEYSLADSFEVFVEDDAFEGDAFAVRKPFDFFELIGESDTREGRALVECPLSYIRNVAMFTEYHTREKETVTKRSRWNALKFGASREVNSKEGVAIGEG